MDSDTVSQGEPSGVAKKVTRRTKPSVMEELMLENLNLRVRISNITGADTCPSEAEDYEEEIEEIIVEGPTPEPQRDNLRTLLTKNVPITVTRRPRRRRVSFR